MFGSSLIIDFKDMFPIPGYRNKFQGKSHNKTFVDVPVIREAFPTFDLNLGYTLQIKTLVKSMHSRISCQPNILKNFTAECKKS